MIITTNELELIRQLAELKAENKVLKDINEKLMQALRTHDVVGRSEQSLPFYCSNCGNEWDTNKNNACQCGAYIKR